MCLDCSMFLSAAWEVEGMWESDLWLAVKQWVPWVLWISPSLTTGKSTFRFSRLLEKKKKQQSTKLTKFWYSRNKWIGKAQYICQGISVVCLVLPSIIYVRLLAVYCHCLMLESFLRHTRKLQELTGLHHWQLFSHNLISKWQKKMTINKILNLNQRLSRTWALKAIGCIWGMWCILGPMCAARVLKCLPLGVSQGELWCSAGHQFHCQLLHRV